uniref:Uncharacterized protein n=1 Tax=Triticum urartu TaxID=4572 RepID=A0A8R7UBQ0_TRIUA
MWPAECLVRSMWSFSLSGLHMVFPFIKTPCGVL